VKQTRASHEDPLALLELLDPYQLIFGNESLSCLVYESDSVRSVDDLDLSTLVLTHVTEANDKHTFDRIKVPHVDFLSRAVKVPEVDLRVVLDDGVRLESHAAHEIAKEVCQQRTMVKVFYET